MKFDETTIFQENDPVKELRERERDSDSEGAERERAVMYSCVH